MLAFSTVVGGLALILPASLTLLLGWPRIFAPFPVALVFPLFMVGELQPRRLAEVLTWLVMIIPTILFWVVGANLFRGGARPRLYALVAIMALGIFNIWWLATSWSYGLQWQGLTHTVVVTALHLSVYAIGLLLVLKARRAPSFAVSYWGHWCIFLWLAWLSFPYLGELP